jgi:hypothetical protein
MHNGLGTRYAPVRIQNNQTYRRSSRHSQQAGTPNHAHRPERANMVRASFQARHRQPKRNPKADDSHKIDPAPTMAEVGQIPTRLIADMVHIQTKGQRKLLRIGLDDV